MTVIMGDTFTEQDFMTMMGEELEDGCDFYKGGEQNRCNKKATHLQVHSCCGRDYLRCMEHVTYVREFCKLTPIVVCTHCKMELVLDKTLKFIPLDS